MILRIDHLRINLPAGYENQAKEISRRIAELLVGCDSKLLRSVPTLRVPPITIRANSNSGEIARAIVNGIQSALGELQ